MNATENNVTVLNNDTVTTYKITVKNGNNLISFQLNNKIDENNVATAKRLSNEIICELQNLNDTNSRLKLIGYKGNFFKFIAGRKCILSIEKTTINETCTLIKNLEFSFNKLEKLENPELGLNIIFEGALYTNRNNLSIC